MKKLILCLLFIVALNAVAEPSSRELGASFKAQAETPVVICDEVSYKAFCKSHKFDEQKIHFKKEIIYIEIYCCTGHTRRGELKYNYADDGKTIQIMGFITNRRGCNNNGKVARMFAVQRQKVTELTDYRRQKHDIK